MKLEKKKMQFYKRTFPTINPHFISCFTTSRSSFISKRPHLPFVSDDLLQSCNSLTILKQLHSPLCTTGFLLQNPHLTGQLIIKYSKFDDPQSARSLFDAAAGGLESSNSFLWNTMLRGYANASHFTETLELYLLMRRKGVRPNNYTFPFVLKACGSRFSASVSEGKLVHGEVIRTGFDSDVFVEAALVDMYCKCGEMDNGWMVFERMSKRDVVCWTSMITACEKSERAEEALMLFQQMQDEGGGLVAHSVTVVSVASAVAQIGDGKQARSIHAHSLRNGFLEDVFVANSMIAMYSKCGNVEMARLFFDLMEEKKNGISWNSMLSGYNENGRASEAMSLFEQMQVSGPEPNPVTALIVISTSAYLGSLYLGKKMHNFIMDSQFEIDSTLRNAIIDMYAKCGELNTAVQMFSSILPSKRNVSLWNVMISGYGVHGYGQEALQLFSQMQEEEGVEPNHITFTSLLSACSHCGLIEEGKKCFEYMKKYSVKPEMKHYTSMVDMLGRAGYVEEAFQLIKEMPLEANDSVWGALLLACRIHGKTELGEIAAKNLFRLMPEHSGYYVLMSNIYAASSKWQEVGRVREDMKSRGLKKPAAFSVIEFGKEVHGFHTADQMHPERREVYKFVGELVMKMKMAGYSPDLSCVLHDVEEEDKEHILNTHSEKLAVAFGIMKTDDKSSIRVTKNLRVCNDCHSAFKIISNICRRKIVVRDANRFHHFEDGSCSCKDYW